MTSSLNHRSALSELMDDPNADRKQVESTLRYIHRANHILGGYATLRDGLDHFVQLKPNQKHWKILDLGCGDGRQLKVIRDWAKSRDLSVSLAGMDIDKNSVALAKSRPELDFAQFIAADANDPDFDYSEYDIITGTLFFHHLRTEEIIGLFKRWNKAGVSVLVNDLHRSRTAMLLFHIFSRLTNAPAMARHDGAISVARSFRREELEQWARASGYPRSSLKWVWSFRYLLLLWHE